MYYICKVLHKCQSFFDVVKTFYIIAKFYTSVHNFKTLNYYTHYISIIVTHSLPKKLAFGISDWIGEVQLFQLPGTAR